MAAEGGPGGGGPEHDGVESGTARKTGQESLRRLYEERVHRPDDAGSRADEAAAAQAGNDEQGRQERIEQAREQLADATDGPDALSGLSGSRSDVVADVRGAIHGNVQASEHSGEPEVTPSASAAESESYEDLAVGLVRAFLEKETNRSEQRIRERLDELGPAGALRVVRDGIAREAHTGLGYSWAEVFAQRDQIPVDSEIALQRALLDEQEASERPGHKVVVDDAREHEQEAAARMAVVDRSGAPTADLPSVPPAELDLQPAGPQPARKSRGLLAQLGLGKERRKEVEAWEETVDNSGRGAAPRSLDEALRVAVAAEGEKRRHHPFRRWILKGRTVSSPELVTVADLGRADDEADRPVAANPGSEGPGNPPEERPEEHAAGPADSELNQAMLDSIAAEHGLPPGTWRLEPTPEQRVEAAQQEAAAREREERERRERIAHAMEAPGELGEELRRVQEIQMHALEGRLDVEEIGGPLPSAGRDQLLRDLMVTLGVDAQAPVARVTRQSQTQQRPQPPGNAGAMARGMGDVKEFALRARKFLAGNPRLRQGRVPYGFAIYRLPDITSPDHGHAQSNTALVIRHSGDNVQSARVVAMPGEGAFTERGRPTVGLERWIMGNMAVIDQTPRRLARPEGRYDSLARVEAMTVGRNPDGPEAPPSSVVPQADFPARGPAPERLLTDEEWRARQRAARAAEAAQRREEREAELARRRAQRAAERAVRQAAEPARTAAPEPAVPTIALPESAPVAPEPQPEAARPETGADQTGEGLSAEAAVAARVFARHARDDLGWSPDEIKMHLDSWGEGVLDTVRHTPDERLRRAYQEELAPPAAPEAVASPEPVEPAADPVTEARRQTDEERLAQLRAESQERVRRAQERWRETRRRLDEEVDRTVAAARAARERAEEGRRQRAATAGQAASGGESVVLDVTEIPKGQDVPDLVEGELLPYDAESRPEAESRGQLIDDEPVDAEVVSPRAITAGPVSEAAPAPPSEPEAAPSPELASVEAEEVHGLNIDEVRKRDDETLEDWRNRADQALGDEMARISDMMDEGVPAAEVNEALVLLANQAGQLGFVEGLTYRAPDVRPVGGIEQSELFAEALHALYVRNITRPMDEEAPEEPTDEVAVEAPAVQPEQRLTVEAGDTLAGELNGVNTMIANHRPAAEVRQRLEAIARHARELGYIQDYRLEQGYMNARPVTQGSADDIRRSRDFVMIMGLLWRRAEGSAESAPQ